MTEQEVLNDSIWKNRTFKNMFIAYGLSSFGNWLDFAAITILFSYAWKAEPTIIALLPVVYAVPSIFFGQFAGVLADRWNKLHVMILSDIICALFTVLLVFAPNPYWVLPILLLRAAAAVFNTPAQQSLIRSIVAKQHLLKATTLNGIVFQFSKILGPLLGAGIASMFSVSVVIILNSISFILSAVLLLLVGNIAQGEKILNKEQKGNNKASFFAQWKEGWTLVGSNRTLLVSIGYALVTLTAVLMVDSQFAVVLRENAPDYPEMVGWVVSTIGVGSLITITFLKKFKEINHHGNMLGTSNILRGGWFIWLSLFQPGMIMIWPVFGALIGGIGTGLWMVGMNYVLQKEAPQDAVGRVFGIYESLTSTVFIIAPLVGGALVSTIGANGTFKILGSVLLIIGITAVIFQKWIWRKEQSLPSISGTNKL